MKKKSEQPQTTMYDDAPEDQPHAVEPERHDDVRNAEPGPRPSREEDAPSAAERSQARRDDLVLHDDDEAELELPR